MSCVLRRNPPKVGRNPRRTDPLLLVFAAVKKMAPSSREAIGPEVPDECPFSAPSPRGTVVQKSHTVRCLLVSANVPRTKFCSSFFVVQPSTCDPEVDGECAANEVVQFFALIVKSTLSQNTSEDWSFQIFTNN